MKSKIYRTLAKCGMLIKESSLPSKYQSNLLVVVSNSQEQNSPGF